MRRAHHRELVAELRSRITYLEVALGRREEECQALQEVLARLAGAPFPHATGPAEPAPVPPVGEMVPAGMDGFGFDVDRLE